MRTSLRGEAVRLDSKGIARAASQITKKSDAEYYEQQKIKLDGLLGQIGSKLFELGQVLSSMRKRSPAFLQRFAHDNTMFRLESLHNLADTYEIFGDADARDDITFTYYTSMAAAVKLVRQTWKGKPKIETATFSEAEELLKQADIRDLGPTGLATRFCRRFGILTPSEKPFTGIQIPMVGNEIEEYAAGLHPVIEPEFRKWIRQRHQQVLDSQPATDLTVAPLVIGPSENPAPPTSSPSVTVLVSATDNASQIAELIRKTLSNNGIKADVMID